MKKISKILSLLLVMLSFSLSQAYLLDHCDLKDGVHEFITNIKNLNANEKFSGFIYYENLCQGYRYLDSALNMIKSNKKLIPTQNDIEMIQDKLKRYRPCYSNHLRRRNLKLLLGVCKDRMK